MFSVPDLTSPQDRDPVIRVFAMTVRAKLGQNVNAIFLSNLRFFFKYNMHIFRISIFHIVRNEHSSVIIENN